LFLALWIFGKLLRLKEDSNILMPNINIKSNYFQENFFYLEYSRSVCKNSLLLAKSVAHPTAAPWKGSWLCHG
jgi:hypothetical protein